MMHKSRMHKAGMIAAAVASVLSAGSAWATDYVWNGSVDPNWSTGGNWTPGGPPTATADTMAFNNTTAAASALGSTVDAGLTQFTFTKLSYTQDDATKTFTTTIPAGVTLTLKNTSASLPQPTANLASTYLSMLVAPTTGSSASGVTGSNVVIQGSAPGTGALKVTDGYMIVTGRPAAAVTSNESYAVLNLSGLDTFFYDRTPIFNTGTSSWNIVGQLMVGTGNTNAGTTQDPNPYYGRLILADHNTINSNRTTIGGQSGNAAGNVTQEPVSTLVLGLTNDINRAVPGNLYVGSDSNAPSKDPSGAVYFRPGLDSVPTVTIGDPAKNTYFGDAFGNRNGLRIGDTRDVTSSTQHHAYGVIDATTASGGTDGSFNAWVAVARIGEGPNASNSGGAAGMLSFDRGLVDATQVILGATRNAGNVGKEIGQLNIGIGPNGAGDLNVANVALDGGSNIIRTVSNLIVGQRSQNTNTSESTGIINMAGTSTVTVDRVFLADNNQTNDATHTGSVSGILNLGGGTLITGQIQAGSDTNPGNQLIGNATRFVNFNGGKIQVSSATNAANFMKNLTGAYVYSAGGTIDTNGIDTVIDQALLAPSGKGVTATIDAGNGGSGYKAAPIVMVTGGGGKGATAVARINSAGVVTGITVTNPGVDYTSTPNFEMLANAGSTYANMQTPFAGTAATVTRNLADNVSGGITKMGAGTLTLNGANNYGGATTVNQGKLVFGQSLTTSSALNASGGNIELAAGGTKIFKTNAVTANTGNQINLQDNKLAVVGGSVGAQNGGIYDGITGMVQAGRNGGTWDGTGIVTGMTAAQGAMPLTTLAVSSAADAKGISGGQTATFGGQTVNPSDVLVMYTYAGDANLSGKIDADDYFAIDSNYNKPASAAGYAKGDFNYDGQINGDDYFLIDQNFTSQLAPFSPAGLPGGVSAVPEPASLALLGVGAAGVLRRRRRR